MRFVRAGKARTVCGLAIASRLEQPRHGPGNLRRRAQARSLVQPQLRPCQLCLPGLVMAMVDVMATNHVNARTSCVPINSITPAQAVGIVSTWLYHHWQFLNLAADDLTARGLQDAFPCE